MLVVGFHPNWVWDVLLQASAAAGGWAGVKPFAINGEADKAADG